MTEQPPAVVTEDRDRLQAALAARQDRVEPPHSDPEHPRAG
jgi:hypothetical protein